MGKEERKESIARALWWERDGRIFRPVFSVGTVHMTLEDLGATFSKKTTRRLLKELEEEGYVVEREGRGYYQLSREGVKEFTPPESKGGYTVEDVADE